MKRIGFNLAQLVFCPFSNLEGQWFWDDGELRAPLAVSRLYMICQRRELFFANITPNTDDLTLTFDMVCGDLSLQGVRMPLLQFKGSPGAVVIVEGGTKIIRFHERQGAEGEKRLIYWFTPDKLLFLFWRGDLQAQNLAEFRQLLNFKLHYVGISKEHDSFSRLYDTAHKGRTRILSLEKPFRDGANLTDELTLLLFDISHNEVQTPEDSDENDDSPLPELSDKTAVIADAEKAFVHVLKPKYNEAEYPNYPASSDGLANEGLTRYFFMLDDPIAVFTEHQKLRGGDFYEKDRAKVADMITVEGTQVSLRALREELSATKSDK